MGNTMARIVPPRLLAIAFALFGAALMGSSVGIGSVYASDGLVTLSWAGDAEVDVVPAALSPGAAGTLRVVDDSDVEAEIAWSATTVPVHGSEPVTLRFDARSDTPGQLIIAALSFYDAAGTFMTGQNAEAPLRVSTTWSRAQTTFRDVPQAATEARIVLIPVAHDPDRPAAPTQGASEFRHIEVERGEPWAVSRGRRLTGAELPAVWFDYPEQPIGATTMPPPPTQEELSPIRLTAFRGEIEAFQLGIRGAALVRSIGWEPFSNTDGSSPTDSLPALELFEVERVHPDVPSDSVAIRGAVPDGLVPWAGSMTLGPEDTRALWARCRIPRDVQPGIYQTTVEIRFGGAPSADIPIELRVVGPALPLAGGLPAWVGLPPSWPARFHSVADSTSARMSLIETYLEMFAELRLSALDPAEEAPVGSTLTGWDWTGGEVMTTGSDRRVRIAVGQDTTAPLRSTSVILIDPRSPHELVYEVEALEPLSTYRVDVEWRGEFGEALATSSATRAADSGADVAVFYALADAIPVAATGAALRFTPLTGAVAIDDVVFRPLGASGSLASNGDFQADIASLDLRLHTENFDALVHRAVNELGMSAIRVWLTGAPHGHAGDYRPGNLFGFAEDTPEYAALLPRLAGAVLEHLEARGWTELAYFYPFDEPTDQALSPIGDALRTLGELAPEVDRLITHPPEDELEGAVDLWVPVLSDLWPGLVQERKAKAERVGTYVSCCLPPTVPNLYVDRPPMQARILPLMVEALELDLFLYWSAVHWDSELSGPPAQDPWIDPSTTLVTGEWVGNGDGRLLNPPLYPGAGPALTVRAELLRESLEDIDRLRALQAAVEAKGQPAGLDPTLLTVPASIVDGVAYWTTDPEAIWTWREQVALAAHLYANWNFDPEAETAAAGSTPGPNHSETSGHGKTTSSGCHAMSALVDHRGFGGLLVLLALLFAMFLRPREPQKPVPPSATRTKWNERLAANLRDVEAENTAPITRNR